MAINDDENDFPPARECDAEPVSGHDHRADADDIVLSLETIESESHFSAGLTLVLKLLCHRLLSRDQTACDEEPKKR